MAPEHPPTGFPSDREPADQAPRVVDTPKGSTSGAARERSLLGGSGWSWREDESAGEAYPAAAATDHEVGSIPPDVPVERPWVAAARTTRTLLGRPRAPLALLGILSAASLGARVAYLDKPLTNGGNGLIFDEKYYVNAARVIIHITTPEGDPYHTARLGTDPNAEHPALAKLMIAAGMKVFGDGPLGWRIAPIIFGTLGLLAMYWLVRAAGGHAWLALGAASLFALDNLMMVHGRIATLDIFTVTFMMVAVAAWLRRWWVPAGILLGLAACTKLVAIDALFIIVALEAGRLLLRRGSAPLATAVRARIRPLLLCFVASGVVYIGALSVIDAVVTPVGGPGDCAIEPGGFHNPIGHTRFMLCYAGKLTSPNGPEGIASWPWQWFLNQEPINYYTVNNNVLSNGKVVATHPVVQFQGEMNPAIILLALPALGLAVHTARRWRDDVSILVLAWTAGTFLPFLVIGAPLPFGTGHRTSYLYYMVVVLPGLYLGVARLLARGSVPRAVLAGWIAIAGYWFVTLYPIRNWSGR